MVSRVIPVGPFDLVIFGATGDLARRKILPGLFHRFQVSQMPPEARIIASARSPMSAEDFRTMAGEAIRYYVPEADQSGSKLAQFLERLDYVAVDAQGEAGWAELASKLREGVIRAFYLSVGPSLFGDIAQALQRTGLATPQARIVVEKPFGHDLASAEALNAALRHCFEEHQIYRIDHYLGKETVQNLMVLCLGYSNQVL